MFQGPFTIECQKITFSQKSSNHWKNKRNQLSRLSKITFLHGYPKPFKPVGKTWGSAVAHEQYEGYLVEGPMKVRRGDVKTLGTTNGTVPSAHSPIVPPLARVCVLHGYQKSARTRVKLLFWQLPRKLKKNVWEGILFRFATEPW